MHELQYLRDELKQRIVFDNDSQNKLINTILVTWGGAFALFAAIQQISVGWLASCPAMPERSTAEITEWTVSWYFATISIFFISTVILYSYSQRFFDNINGVLRLAAYSAVFHEKRPAAGDKEDMIRAWELATFELTQIEMKDKYEKRRYKINNEMFFLTLFAIFTEILFWSILFRNIISGSISVNVLDKIMVAICVIFIIISSFLSFQIRDKWVLKPEKWHERKKNYYKKFINYAVETGYYTNDKLEERFGKKVLDEIGYTTAPAEGGI